MAKWEGFYKIIQAKPDAKRMTDSQEIGDSSSYGHYSWYARLVQGSASRLTRYRQYDLMDQDIEISRALDTIAEEMTGNNTKTDEPIELNIDNIDKKEIDNTLVTTIKAALDHWVKIHNWDNRLFDIARYTAKYGDCFFRKEDLLTKWIFVHPTDVVAAIVNDDNITDVLGWQVKKDLYKAKTSYGVPISGTDGMSGMENLDKSQIVRFTLNNDMSDSAPFGDSVLKSVYRAQRQKELLEDAIIIYRIQRAPERRVFYIDVGKMPPNRIKQYLEQVKNEIKQRKVPSPRGGQSEVDAIYNPQSTNEDFFLAQRCLKLNTCIPLLNGKVKTLSDIIEDYNNGVQNWTYSVDRKTGKFIPGKISWAGLTRKNAELVRVTLDNGEIVECTPDHKFVLRDGSEIEAQYLNSGTSLMPLYRKRVKTNKSQKTSKYEMVLDNSTGKYRFTHLEVCPKENKDNVIHHICYDPSNNDPTNLVEMTKEDHWKIHSKNGHNLGKMWKENREVMISGIRNYLDSLSDEEKSMRAKRSRDNARSGWRNNRENLEISLENNRNKFIKKFETKEDYLKHFSKMGKIYWENISEEDYKKQQERTASFNTKTKGHRVNEILASKFLNIYNDNNGLSSGKLVILLHENYDFMSEFKYENSENFRVKRRDMVLFGGKYLNKLTQKLGYENYSDFKKNYSFNHKVLKIEFLDYKEDTGCLTIDDPGENHNFALEAGVYVCNSDGKGSKIETLPGGCLDLNTKICNLDGTEKTLSKMIENHKNGIQNWVYSCDPITGEFVPGKVSWAGITKENVEVFELLLDNGEKVIATEDHKFPIWGKGQTKLRDIEINDSIISFNLRDKPIRGDLGNTYTQVLDHSTKKYEFVHRKVANFMKNKGIEKSIIFNEKLKRSQTSKNNVLKREYIERLEKIRVPWQNQKIQYSSDMITIIRHLFENGYDTQEKLVTRLNNTPEFMNLWLLLNSPDEDKICHISQNFTNNNLGKLLEYFGYKKWDDFKFERLQILKFDKTKIDKNRYSIDQISLIKFLIDDALPISKKLSVIENKLKNTNLERKFISLCKKCNIKNGYGHYINKLRDHTLTLATKTLGFDSFKSFIEYSPNFNHRVISITKLNQKRNVGTITVDQNEELHNYHTFALSAGVYTFNSGLGEITDLEYFQDKVFRGLRIPTSYMKQGGEGAIFTDGKVGVAYIQELRFSLYIQRLQGALEKVLDEEFKKYLRTLNIRIDMTTFNLQLPEPSNFGKFKQQEVDAALMGAYSSVDAIPYFAKRFALKRFGQLTDDEILENEHMKLEELGLDPDKYDKDTLKTIYSGPPEEAGLGAPGALGLPGAGMFPGGLEGGIEAPETGVGGEAEAETPPAI